MAVVEGKVGALAVSTWTGLEVWCAGTSGFQGIASSVAIAAGLLHRSVVIHEDGNAAGREAAAALCDELLLRSVAAAVEPAPSGLDPAESLSEDWRERAAIREYDAGLDRVDAEASAWEDFRASIERGGGE